MLYLDPECSRPAAFAVPTTARHHPLHSSPPPPIRPHPIICQRCVLNARALLVLMQSLALGRTPHSSTLSSSFSRTLIGAAQSARPRAAGLATCIALRSRDITHSVSPRLFTSLCSLRTVAFSAVPRCLHWPVSKYTSRPSSVIQTCITSFPLPPLARVGSGTEV